MRRLLLHQPLTDLTNPTAQKRPAFYIGVLSVESILNGTDKPLSEILKVNQSNKPNDPPRYVWDEMQNPFSSILP